MPEGWRSLTLDSNCVSCGSRPLIRAPWAVRGQRREGGQGDGAFVDVDGPQTTFPNSLSRQRRRLSPREANSRFWVPGPVVATPRRTACPHPLLPLPPGLPRYFYRSGSNTPSIRAPATAHVERNPEVSRGAHAGSKGFKRGGRSPRAGGGSQHLSVIPHSSACG